MASSLNLSVQRAPFKDGAGPRAANCSDPPGDFILVELKMLVVKQYSNKKLSSSLIKSFSLRLTKLLDSHIISS
jgi:hypothetical protein